MSKRDNVAAVRRYRAKRYRSFDQRLVSAFESAAIRRYLKTCLEAGCTVLDMPVGYGRLVHDLHERGVAVVGADKNRAMLQVACEQHGVRMKPVQLRGSHLPFRDKSFDVVICIRLMQHLRDPDQQLATLQEIGRVCRRAAIVTTYVHSPVHSFFRNRRSSKYLHLHSVQRLQKDIARANMRLEDSARPLTRLHSQTILLLEPLA